jgi:hypothetical protein
MSISESSLGKTRAEGDYFGFVISPWNELENNTFGMDLGQR